MLFDTVDITRIPFDSPIELSIAVSQMQWPKANMKKSPRVIVLTPDQMFPYAFAASSLVHDPIMGNILMMPANELPVIIREEIERLDPSGTEDVPPIIAVGPFEPTVISEIEDIGYPVAHIAGRDIFTTAIKVARLREQITPQSPDGPLSIFIVSANAPYEGVLATYYATHSGVPILFTLKNQLPSSTARALHDMPNKHVYIIGGRHAIAETVAREITGIMNQPVRRIAGEDPFETSVAFSKYYDPETQLGWNRVRKGQGDAFTFGNLNCWNLIVAASSMAHQGKHTPLLLVDEDCVPPVVLRYLKYLKPSLTGMHPMPPFMHGFILGSYQVIDYGTQAYIEESIKIDEQPEK